MRPARALRPAQGIRLGWLGTGDVCVAREEEIPIVDLDLKGIISEAGRLVERFGDEAYFAALCVRSGMVGPIELPHRVAKVLLAFDGAGFDKVEDMVAGGGGGAAVAEEEGLAVFLPGVEEEVCELFDGVGVEGAKNGGEFFNVVFCAPAVCACHGPLLRKSERSESVLR